MEISAEINLLLEEARAESEEFAALSEDDQRAASVDSLVRLIGKVAGEELKSHGQKAKVRKSGAQLTVIDGKYCVDFSVVFEGNYDGATAAVQSWAERVGTFGGIAQITRVSLRGTDGTNEHAFSDEIVATAESLDEETRARIDELMDPSRGDD